MLRNKIIIVKILFLVCTIAIGPLSLEIEQVREYCALIFLFVILFLQYYLHSYRNAPIAKSWLATDMQ